jgi:hypothetical protein
MSNRLVRGLLGVSLAAALAFGSGCSCGGNTADNPQDAAPDSFHQFDATSDVPLPDASPTCNPFTAAAGCGFELTACTAAKTNSDECGGDLDCVDSGLYGLTCLKKCNCSEECGVNNICMPSKSSDYVGTDATQIIGSANGHCFYSFCGGEGDSTSPVGNGSFFGACTMGAEAYFKAGAVHSRPGTCFPIFNDVDEGYIKVGQCQEIGAVKRGGQCSFDLNQCYEPSTFDTCALGTTCIGRQGSQVGTCAKLCDPHATGFNPAVPGGCAADTDVAHDQYCQDSSDYQWDCTDPVVDGGVPTYRGTPVRNYVGFCVDTQGCDLFAAANACATVVSDGGVAWNGCEPTSPVDSYGLCGVTGSVGLGGTCNSTLLCQGGLVCITTSTSTTGTCEKYCGLGPNDGKWPCGSGEMCDRIRYGSDTNPKCWNDPLSLGFGICKPDTRQDAGVQQDAGNDA